MSRSYKKYPGWSGRSRKSKIDKRFANKVIRKTFNVPGGKAYRKIADSWNIIDYNFRYYSKKDAIRELTKHYGLKVYQSWMK